MIKHNIAKIKEDISLICQRLGRNPSEIKLVCVTKTATAEMILEALQNGITDIGENKVKEAEEKFSKLKELYPVKFHMVGHLQANKVKKALEIFDLIQSVDNLHLAQVLEKEAGKLNKTAEVLIEVNTSNEPQKFGVKPEEALSLIGKIAELNRIRIQGLMTVAKESEDSEEIRNCFKKLRLLKDEISQEFNLPNVQMKYLSMGMTNDYKIALEEGSNMLRIGRAIFESIN